VLNRPQLRDEGGFLLIDLITAAALLLIMLGAYSVMYSGVGTRESTLQTQAALAATARPMLDSMAAELQSAMCNGSTQPITAANGTAVTFTTPDRQQPFHLQQITYSMASGTLTRQLAQSTNTGGPPWTLGTPVTTDLVSNVTNSVVFDFLSSSGTDLSPGGATVTAANLPNIARVVMTLVVAPPPSNGTGSLTSQTSASLRTPTCN
jgi:Tfp pilus assembly protein PilV